MAQREDIILKRLQTNIAEHEGRKEEAEAEGGAMGRIAQNVLLESELAGKFTEKIMQPIEQFMDEKEERAAIARKEDITDFYETQRHESLFGRTEYNVETGERTHIKPAQNILERTRGRLTGISSDGEFTYTPTPGSKTSYIPGWEALSDMDTQVLMRASTKGVWINADGTYKTMALGNMNNLSDDGIKVVAQNKNANEEPVKEPVKEPDKKTELTPQQILAQTLSSYETNASISNPDILHYKNWGQRGKARNIIKHVNLLKEDPTMLYSKNYLKNNAPDVYEAYLNTLPTEGEEE